MSTVDDLTKKVDRLHQQLRQAKESLRAARIAEAPVSIGDVVTDRLGREHRITEITPRSWGYDLRGNFRKKDGEWSSAVRHIYGWKVTP